MILVHGLALNMLGNWMLPRVFQRLSRRYRVIALDNRGHGKSDKPYDPAQYGLELVDDVVRLMDHLGIAKAHVVGYSLGGFITLKLALRHPDRLLSAAPCGAGWSANPAEELKLLYQPVGRLGAGARYHGPIEVVAGAQEAPSHPGPVVHASAHVLVQ